MGQVDLEKLRSISIGGKHRDDSRVRVLTSDQGATTGFQIDHPDGRVEAIVRPEPVRASVSLSTGKVTNHGS